jgi:predicted Rossmann-fold nucleotide-binding protein
LIDGGQVTGVIPESLAPREISGETKGKIVVVNDMHTRKLTMYKLSDAFIGIINASFNF